MERSARPAHFDDIRPWRDLYRQDMNCQIVHDSLHARPGWTRPYLLTVGGVAAGYGAVVLGGPWTGKPALFEFYVQPHDRTHVFDLFQSLLSACRPATIEAQTNDALLTVMLHVFARGIAVERILFHDRLTTQLVSPGAVFRPAASQDVAAIAARQLDAGAEWVLTVDDAVAATGGILHHYNRPYGDLYMSVTEPLRRRGLGSYLVQELKRACYERGSVPAARCRPENVASRKTLQKAGFVPCGCILTGAV